MGYTHYWDHNGYTDEQWKVVKKQAEAIIHASNISVQYEYDEERPLTDAITDEVIRFNGVEDDGHETFYMTKSPTEFAFCKTAYKPYDEIVVAMLVMMDHVGVVNWRSDGGDADHQDGIDLYNTAIG